MKAFFILIFFLFICGPVFKSIGAGADTIPIVSVIIVFLSVFFLKGEVRKCVFNTQAFFLVFGAFVISLISIVLGGGEEHMVKTVLKPIRIIVTLWGGVLLVRWVASFVKREVVIFYVCYFSCIAIALHGGVMFAQYFSPSFKNWVYSWATTEEFRSSFEYNFRMGGFSGTSGGAMLSFLQALGGVFGVSALFRMREITPHPSLMVKIALVLGTCLALSSSFLAGRTGPMICCPFLFVYAWMQNTGAARIKWVLVFSMVSALGAMALSLLYTFVSNAFWEDSLSGLGALTYTMNRNLDVLVGDGGGSSETIGRIAQMIHIPDKVSILLFGIPGEDLLRMSGSDIGYIRNLWNFGVIGASCFLGPAIYWLFYSFHARRYMKDEAIRFSLGLVWAILFLTLVAHFKEQACYARMLLSCFGIALGLYFYEKEGSSCLVIRQKSVRSVRNRVSL